MEVFGMPLQDLIFSIFLPFILFYLIFYALLRKSKILGDVNTLDVMTALVLSSIVIYSAYAIGIIQYISTIGVIIAIASFAVVFLYGSMATASKKIESYMSGEAFKTEDEKKFDALKTEATKLWDSIKKDWPRISPSDFSQLQEKIKTLEELSRKVGKDLNTELPWYQEYKNLIKGD